jgi:hypothetical protein
LLRSRFLALGLLAAALSACGGGGGGGSSTSPSIVSGSLVAPGGVADGTVVELVEFDPAGSGIVVLGQTRAANGRYSIDVARFGRTIAPGLAIRVGSGANQMTALILRAETDVGPLSETLAHFYRSGARAGFTLQELTELEDSLRFLFGARGVEQLPDISATVALMQQVAADDPGFLNFLDATRVVGETSEGPGDLADFFADELNEVSGFFCTRRRDSEPATFFTNARRVRVENSAGLRTIEELNSFNGGLKTEIYQETTRALTMISSPDPRDALAASAIPYDELRFPLVIGRSWTQFDVRGVQLDADFDNDQIPDTLDAVATRTPLGFENLTLLAGAFPNCLRLQTVKTYTMGLSGGGIGLAKTIEDEWYAAGIGLVRRSTLGTTDLHDLHRQTEWEEELTAYQANGNGLGLLPYWPLAEGIQIASTEVERPGRPAIASDGQDFLVVTQRFDGRDTTLIAVRVSPTGVGEVEFELAELQPLSAGTTAIGSHPTAAYDGERFVVAYESAGQIFALSTTIDGMGISFPVQVSGQSDTNTQPAVAFDGQEFLVVWSSLDDENGEEIHGRRLLGEVPVGDEIVLHSSLGDQVAPALTFAGDRYWLAWTDNADLQVRGRLLTPFTPENSPVETLVISEAPEEDFDPSFSFDGTNVLVVWAEADVLGEPDGNAKIMGRRFTLAGESLEGPFEIASVHRRQRSPSVAFDGENHIVTWWIDDLDSPGGIRLARISPDGELLDGPSTQPGLSVDVRPNPTRLAYPVIVGQPGRALIAYLVNRERSGQTKDVVSALVYPF